jgi:hypothetical protein
MRKFLGWLIVLLLLAAGVAWWLDNRGEDVEQTGRDAGSVEIATPEAAQPVAPAAPHAALPTPPQQTDGLPDAPVPYEKLDTPPAAEDHPEPKKDDNTIFY